MGDLEKQERLFEEEEKERLLEDMAVLDFDMLCSTVALQTQGKWTKLGSLEEQEGGELGGVLRMWEGELLDCFDNPRIALQSTCCPWYRFGKNMRRAGFGSCYIQGSVYLLLAFGALMTLIAFILSKQYYFLCLAVAFSFTVGTYLGFFRSQIRKKFNIKGSNSSVDDCIYHLVCPPCTLCQESRTLEMNNVRDGIWQGRGDTICVGGFNEVNRAIFELHLPPLVTINAADNRSVQKSADVSNEC